MVSHRDKPGLIKRDRYGEEKGVFIQDFLKCRACSEAIVMADPGCRWRDIDKAYLRHVKICFPLKRLIAMEWKEQRQTVSQQKMGTWLNAKTKRIMAQPKNPTNGHVLKRDLIQCPQCKLEQLALVIEISEEEMLLQHECRLCKHEFTAQEFAANVIIQDFDNRNTNLLTE
jgi:hypothetical protein